MNIMQTKVSSPRGYHSLKKSSQEITPRSDEQYTRIEQYDDVNFLNSLMFEFNLRIDRFQELYEAYSELFMPLEANQIFLSEFLRLEKDKQSFLEFGYDSQQMLTYIFWMQNKAISRVYNQYENIETLVKSFGTYMHKAFQEIYQDDYENILQNKTDILEIEPFKILKHNFLHPEFIPSKYTEFNLSLSFNALENKDVVQNRVKSLIDDFYDRFNKIDRIYFRNSQTKDVALSINTDIESTKKIAGRNNQKTIFANHFYIFDQKKKKIANETILEELNKYSSSSTLFNIKTLKKYNKKMNEWIQNKTYKNFYYDVTEIDNHTSLD